MAVDAAEAEVGPSAGDPVMELLEEGEDAVEVVDVADTAEAMGEDVEVGGDRRMGEGELPNETELEDAVVGPATVGGSLGGSPVPVALAEEEEEEE